MNISSLDTAHSLNATQLMSSSPVPSVNENSSSTKQIFDSLRTMGTLVGISLEKLNVLDQRIMKIELDIQQMKRELFQKVDELKKQTRKRKKELSKEEAQSLNQCLAIIRSEVKERLPDFPTYENSIDKARIVEVEENLQRHPLIKTAFEIGLLHEESLHDAVLRCLAEQRRSPYKSNKYIEKKRKLGNENDILTMTDSDPNTLSFPLSSAVGSVDGETDDADLNNNAQKAPIPYGVLMEHNQHQTLHK